LPTSFQSPDLAPSKYRAAADVVLSVRVVGGLGVALMHEARARAAAAAGQACLRQDARNATQ
jgi:hypothetical protein